MYYIDKRQSQRRYAILDSVDCSHGQRHSSNILIVLAGAGIIQWCSLEVSLVLGCVPDKHSLISIHFFIPFFFYSFIVRSIMYSAILKKRPQFVMLPEDAAPF